MTQLYDKLKQNQNSGIYPYHMPGHKRNMKGFALEECYGIDITEIDGFDNLHQPDGVIKEIMERAEKLFGAETYLLVNGSTGGILSAVSAAVNKGETLLMARNCHKAVYHAVYLRECRTEYCYPQFLEEYGICGEISTKRVRKLLEEKKEIRAVLLTSPTYDGVISNVEEIVRAAHERGIPVIVDEAHGAHLSLDERFPKGAVECGADLVIHSIHKTLPAFTQTALLHVQGNLIDRKRLRRFLQIYQTSSPSYLLMAGIEQCLDLLENNRTSLYNRFFIQNKIFAKKLEALKHLKVLSADNAPKEVYAFDMGKKLLSARGCGMSGQELSRMLLEKYGLQMEMAGWDYATAIMTLMDTEEGYRRLGEAILEMDACIPKQPKRAGGKMCIETAEGQECVYPIYEAWEKKSAFMLLDDCIGCVSAEFVYIYPPGIPLVVPGERILEETVMQLQYYRMQGFTIEGLYEGNKKIAIIQEENS